MAKTRAQTRVNKYRSKSATLGKSLRSLLETQESIENSPMYTEPCASHSASFRPSLLLQALLSVFLFSHHSFPLLGRLFFCGFYNLFFLNSVVINKGTDKIDWFLRGKKKNLSCFSQQSIFLISKMIVIPKESSSLMYEYFCNLSSSKNL